MNDNYLEHIRNEIITTETKVLVREYKNNLDKLTRNYNIGKELTLAGKHYGEGIVKKYANILTKEFGTTYGFTNLNYMRQFYNFIEKFHALHGNLTWNHYLKLLPLNDINEVNYYIHITMRDNLSYRNLSLRIKNDEYHRLPPETRDKLETNKKIKSGEEVLNPIIVRTNNLKEKFTEKVLQEMIISDLDYFLEQLGGGFTYVGREYKVQIGNTFNYIDILLYNYIRNCFVVVELKITELRKEYLGQIKTYMNIVDKEIKKPTHNKTIGILITKEMNNFEVSLIDSNNVYKTTFKIELNKSANI
jgi:predicted nuclease of restriction endonuclease-like (RecB) superfamily